MSDNDVIHLNGHAVPAACPGTRLLDWLREDVRETGPKEGCGRGHCGACTVLVDGRPVPACTTLVQAAVGRQVHTAAGLSRTPEGRAVVSTFVEYDALQCGFCGPGMTVVAVAWLANRVPGTAQREEVAEALSGNICRCTGYARLIDALIAAADTQAGSS
jgi:carbon-monoxide dehydrogenase small subunit